jgi:hypothetical protein
VNKPKTDHWPELWAVWFPGFDEYARSGSDSSSLRTYFKRHEAEADAERCRDRLRNFFPDSGVEIRRITVGGPNKETASEPPDIIYLQWNGDGDPNDLAKVHEPEVTWSREQIYSNDVPYIAASAAHVAIQKERKRQLEKWGVQNHDWDRWALILSEEIGEVAKAILEDDAANYFEEVVQVAAVAHAILECEIRRITVGGPEETSND